jgi:hypothetical protein
MALFFISSLINKALIKEALICEHLERPIIDYLLPAEIRHARMRTQNVNLDG